MKEETEMTMQEMTYPSPCKDETSLLIVKDKILWQTAAKASAASRTEIHLHTESGEELGG